MIAIRTPENIELSYALAGPGSRAAAYFIDLLVMSVVCQMLINLLVAGFGLLMYAVGENSELWISAIATLGVFALYNGYFILLEWLLNGQTPGKRLLHIRVIKQGGYSLRFFDTLLRNLLRVVDFLPLFYGVGLTSLLLTRDSQRLGDLVAGTLVVYQEPVETESLLPDLPAPDESELPLPAVQLAAIPDEAISLAAQYLSLATSWPRGRVRKSRRSWSISSATSGLEPRPSRASRASSHPSSDNPSKPLHGHSQLRRRLNSLLDQSPRDLLPVLGELLVGVDHSRTGPAVAVATKQGITIRNRHINQVEDGNKLAQPAHESLAVGERRRSVLRLHDPQARHSLADPGAAKERVAEEEAERPS